MARKTEGLITRLAHGRMSMKGTYIRYRRASNRGTWLHLGAGEGLPRTAMLQLGPEGHRVRILAPSLHPALTLGEKKEWTD